ncbi:MAG: 3-dehydroquinate synthase [Spirochaetota bacterium]
MVRSFRFGGYTCTTAIVAADELYAGLDTDLFALADVNTAQYLPASAQRLELPTGETWKSWNALGQILDRMLDADLTRDSTVVGVGGGVVTDIAACAASLYMRGCTLILVPTSLLAMVDAAIGGKTGVNFGGYKNMVGTFYPAREVRIAPEVLRTLPEREFRSGLAEAIKTALLGDEALLDLLEREPDRVLARDPDLLADAVWRCVEVKGGIVEADLVESGVRAYLNLGHTFAHALESVEGLGVWTHGEAVAWGLAQAMRLGVASGITDAAYARRVRSILERYEYRVDPLPAIADAVRDAMNKDKKRRRAGVRFVLQRRLGETTITEVGADALDAVLRGG